MNDIDHRMTEEGGPRKLDTGAGTKLRPGFIRNDIRPLDGIDIVY